MSLLDRLRALFSGPAPSRVAEEAEEASLTHPFFRGDPVRRYSFASLYGPQDRALEVPAVSGIVRLIAGNVAKLPIHAYRLYGDRRRRERDHWVETLLNARPNTWQNGNEFRRQLTSHVLLYGNGFALKRMSGAAVDELIPWHPSYVDVKQDSEESPPVYTFRRRQGGSLSVPASDVLHLRDLTLDGCLGVSRVEEAQQGLVLSMAAETYATAYFMNGAEAGMALETDRNLTPDQRKALIESWKASHQGPNRAHAPTVLEGGLKAKQTTVTNKDAQFLELRSFQVEDYARRFPGVPPHLIGLSEKQTSWGTGVEAMATGFLRFCLLDYTDMWDAAINRDLLSGLAERGMFVEHIVESLLRADIKTRMDAYALAIQNGMMSRNEVRQKENLPPYEGGDEYLYPANLTDGKDRGQPADELEAVFPSHRDRHRWRRDAIKALRIVGDRKAG